MPKCRASIPGRIGSAAMIGHDRDGKERQIAMMRCSVGVLELPEGLMIEDLNKIGAAIASIKA